ncbi:hypothetical protein [Methylocella sp.]|uniref:hypothetical protein n=1 Tax=Methylocella sp. TaxID=1978226 RepID=UPI0035B43884
MAIVHTKKFNREAPARHSSPSAARRKESPDIDALDETPLASHHFPSLWRMTSRRPALRGRWRESNFSAVVYAGYCKEKIFVYKRDKWPQSPRESWFEESARRPEAGEKWGTQMGRWS